MGIWGDRWGGAWEEELAVRERVRVLEETGRPGKYPTSSVREDLVREAGMRENPGLDTGRVSYK